MPEQIALKFPAGTRARLHSLAGPGETMTSVILRALDRLSEPDALADLRARVTALEQRREESPTTGDSRHYTAPERALAITLDQQGRRPVEIRRALLAQFGRAPRASSMRRQLRLWQTDLDHI
ncbi:hypothetical protein [Thiobaca trueperi]|uniref:Uncharacterized protein n=1 Tax=Thiobaca trueperi TaxID=127458 RepID=A0A4R3MXJ1_9GAMM|nr:hypothetical protein [Thiobaca trueperi]TCT20271.1 hypothetical protein EDC35_106198 [Thiobaca trueperi]